METKSITTLLLTNSIIYNRSYSEPTNFANGNNYFHYISYTIYEFIFMFSINEFKENACNNVRVFKKDLQSTKNIPFLIMDNINRNNIKCPIINIKTIFNVKLSWEISSKIFVLKEKGTE